MPGDWSGQPIERIIDRELGRNPELRSGMAAYAALLTDFGATGNDAPLLEGILDHAATQYRKAGVPDAQLVILDDGAVDLLFDLTRERTVIVWGRSRSVAPNTRDSAYHAGYPRAGDGLDKGHAWSHAQGGREGGPNYFRQARRLNQARSDNGLLWRAIEQHLAANAGLRAFVRLIYGAANASDRPDEVEYGILPASGQFRAVIFPNR
ncbi:hypothetical protein [Roseomonas sp. AR75]|uniref:hypothetical protein n=1 Tax=Roseomonas sp. AR75 TaxID=2562311 RepID=UPI0010BFF0C3|nr:hypothetical protein [Roseomonas sp. AR75]